MKDTPHYCFMACIKVVLLLCLAIIDTCCYAQNNDSLKIANDGDSLARPKAAQRVDSFNKQFDFADLYNALLHPKKKEVKKSHKSGVTVIPNIAANPTIGLQGGIKAVAGKVLGKQNYPDTYMSVAATSASITTKGILYFYITHNVFTPGNKWNFQGSIVAAKSVTPDFGQGIGEGSAPNTDDALLINALRKPYIYHSQYYKFYEKAYKQIKNNLFVGGGLEFDIRRKLTVAGKNPEEETPQDVYNNKYGFAKDHYMSNGLLFDVEYTTRDNQNRPYKGMYFDAGLRVNQTWLGSSQSASQLTLDFRKYVSLSMHNPAHVLAFWTWSSYVLGGVLPYLELPGTGRDPNFRSGRGYTAQYFKSTKYFYSEAEYRFPIMRNQFLSGVVFANVQSANNEVRIKLFEVWQPAAGAGLRVLFNKATRTNLCLDYAWGRYGSKGFFLGLNEAF